MNMQEDIVAMARAAKADERLSDGALYGKLADEIERLRAAHQEIEDKYAAIMREPPDWVKMTPDQLKWAREA